MEALTQKQARLRHELQRAYSAWLESTDVDARGAPTSIQVDVSGCRDAVKARWFEYLAAKHRLILAYAERA